MIFKRIWWELGLFLDFLVDHSWAQVLVTVVVVIATSLITMLLLAYLMAGGYIPRPQW